MVSAIDTYWTTDIFAPWPSPKSFPPWFQKLSPNIALNISLNFKKRMASDTQEECFINERFWDLFRNFKTDQVKPVSLCQNPSQKQIPKTY